MSANGHYTPLGIYKNLPTFFEYRSLELVSGSMSIESRKARVPSSASSASVDIGKKWLSDDEFIKTIQYQGYIVIQAKDTSDRKRTLRNSPMPVRKLPVKTIIILFDDIEKFTKTPAYKALLEKIPNISNSRSYNLDIITIARDDPSVHLRKAIANIESPGSADGGYTKIFSRKYVLLRNINPLHVNVPKIRVLDEEERADALAALHTDPLQLPRVFDSDAIMIWYPIEVGDIVEELHASETVGYEKIYRLVVPTPQIEK
jgi:DNA-directed RNA polymerase subunit H (RpoH/RPB5)